MASKKKRVILVLILLAFGELIESTGFGKFNKLFPLKEEEKKCFRRAKNGQNKDGSEHQTSEEEMTSSQEPLLSPSSHETTKGGGQDTKQVSSPGLSTKPVTDVPQWHQWNESFYTFVSTTEMTWEDAANACSSMRVGARLVFIESELENKEVSRLAKVASEGRNNRWWIGLTDRVAEGVWKWYNVSLNYNNWWQGQPDNSGKNEDCGVLGFRWNGDNAFWADTSCTQQKKFICESGFGNDL
ncbi:Perlucin-like protein [Holothuria leucospilota]|uniref:Perlucin-like protein n=1 Tax=Holothuria leucospilota TaxID=206669 RepID=A0A9Q1C8D4_HOLLE|nr:Perlucin-like protein [Holothuria leucospilota]